MNGSGPRLFEAVIESWRLVIGNTAALARTALLPLVIFIALERLDSAFRPEGAAILAWQLLLTILAAPPAVMLLMPWYRRLLTAADPAMAARPATWWSRSRSCLAKERSRRSGTRLTCRAATESVWCSSVRC